MITVYIVLIGHPVKTFDYYYYYYYYGVKRLEQHPYCHQGTLNVATIQKTPQNTFEELSSTNTRPLEDQVHPYFTNLYLIRCAMPFHDCGSFCYLDVSHRE